MFKIDSETAKKVMDILSNPEMLNKISAIASGVSTTKQPPPQQEAVPASIFQNLNNASTPIRTDSKSDLLLALKPLLKESKRGKVDAVIKALTVTAAISKIKEGGTFNV